MTQEDKELLLKDLCSRLPYKVIVHICSRGENAVRDVILSEDNITNAFEVPEGWWKEIKPYLRPMSSITEVEAREIATLHGLKDILSLKITDEYIDVIIDDGFSSTGGIALWYDDIISSIEIFDYLNAHHFDYRGLIPKGLALEAPDGMYNLKEQ